MKKCPRCLILDNDEIRFCKKCGTELFYASRFPENRKIKEMTQQKDDTNRHTPVYREHPDAKGLVAFIHGFMGSPRQFAGLIDFTYNQGFSVAALLLPGHGGSAKYFGTGRSEIWQDFVDSKIEQFSIKYKNIILAGHSMGCLLAINASVKYPEYVHGLFLIACPFIRTLVSPYAIKLRFKQAFAQKSNPIKKAYFENCSVKLTPDFLWYNIKPSLEIKKMIHISEDDLPKVKVPVTAVFSTADELISIKSLDILKSGLHDVPFEEIIISDSLHAYYTPEEQTVIVQGMKRLLLKETQ